MRRWWLRHLGRPILGRRRRRAWPKKLDAPPRAKICACSVARPARRSRRPDRLSGSAAVRRRRAVWSTSPSRTRRCAPLRHSGLRRRDASPGLRPVRRRLHDRLRRRQRSAPGLVPRSSTRSADHRRRSRPLDVDGGHARRVSSTWGRGSTMTAGNADEWLAAEAGHRGHPGPGHRACRVRRAQCPRPARFGGDAALHRGRARAASTPAPWRSAGVSVRRDPAHRRGGRSRRAPRGGLPPGVALTQPNATATAGAVSCS